MYRHKYLKRKNILTIKEKNPIYKPNLTQRKVRFKFKVCELLHKRLVCLLNVWCHIFQCIILRQSIMTLLLMSAWKVVLSTWIQFYVRLLEFL